MIKDYIKQDEILFDQLAEEAAELIQAATKLSRIKRGINPTPKTGAQAYINLLEEIADVQACIEVLNLPEVDRKYIDQVQKSKLDRWEQRLQNKE